MKKWVPPGIQLSRVTRDIQWLGFRERAVEVFMLASKSPVGRASAVSELGHGDSSMTAKAAQGCN